MRKVCLGLLLCCFLILPVSGEMAARRCRKRGRGLCPHRIRAFLRAFGRLPGNCCPCCGRSLPGLWPPGQDW